MYSCANDLNVSISVAGSVIVETPQNKVIFKEESLYAIHLPCKSSCQCRLKWYLQKSQDSEKEVLYNGYALRPDAKHYCTAIADGMGNCNLNLTTAEEAAQTYICLEPGTLLEASADLIWIGKFSYFPFSATYKLAALNKVCFVEGIDVKKNVDPKNKNTLLKLVFHEKIKTLKTLNKKVVDKLTK